MNKEEIMKRLKKLIGKDILTQEEKLKEFSKEGEYSLSALKKQLTKFEKEEKDSVKEEEEAGKEAEQITNKELKMNDFKKELIQKFHSEIKPKFKDERLLKDILEELSKDHLEDNQEKMTLFLIYVSALLKNPKRRQSALLTGASSTGKDNAQLTCLKHIPEEIWIFLTNATQSTLEDDISDKRIIAFSEINSNREEGANKHLTEIMKQMTEGGTSALKKDIRTGMKTARFEQDEQKTITGGTTEAELDDEMRTRFMNIGIKTTYSKIKKVNENTLDAFSDMDKLLENSKKSDSWIKTGLNYFFNKDEQHEIYIPYAKFLKEKVEGEDIFDNNSPRSQRDLKRVLALTCAMTYLFQEQRKKVDHKNKSFLISEPQDLINTLKITKRFFDQSYTGLDHRLTEVLKLMGEYIKENNSEFVPRDWMQEKLDVSRNTIRGYCKVLADEGGLKGVNGKTLNENERTAIYDERKIYYEMGQKGVKKPLIRCQLLKLKEFLEKKTKKTIDPFDFLELSYIKEEKEEEKGVNPKGSIEDEKVKKLSFSSKKEEKEDISDKTDPFPLTPFEEKQILEDFS